MAVSEPDLLQALGTVQDPHTGKDFVSTRALRNLQINGGDVAFDVELGYPAKSLVPALRSSLVAAARGVAGVENVSVNITFKVAAHAVQRGVQLLPGVKNIVAVASGKGGVGKSTPPPTWRWHWPPKAPAWACWTPTSTAPASR